MLSRIALPMAGLILFAGSTPAQSGSDTEAERPDPDARFRALSSEYMQLLTKIQVLNRQAAADAATALAAGRP
ncbi:MAG: hypothetical protein VYE77_04165, partial [Planctomycetota bacterium]|nr:hypothetical protein [Planctomycetota bacterium]